MERRGCNLGCIVAVLGLLLSCCLLPYLISSIYSIVTAVLQLPGVPDWLWGDWIRTLVGESDTLYMVLAEGPICCVGTLALLTIILGVVTYISGMGPKEEPEAEPLHEAYEESEEYGDLEGYEDYEDYVDYQDYEDYESYEEP
jgi:hypothetical protein